MLACALTPLPTTNRVAATNTVHTQPLLPLSTLVEAQHNKHCCSELLPLRHVRHNQAPPQCRRPYTQLTGTKIKSACSSIVLSQGGPHASHATLFWSVADKRVWLSMCDLWCVCVCLQVMGVLIAKGGDKASGLPAEISEALAVDLEQWQLSKAEPRDPLVRQVSLGHTQNAGAACIAWCSLYSVAIGVPCNWVLWCRIT